MQRAELQRAVAALDRLLGGMTVRGTAIIAGSLDLCVFFRERSPIEGNALRVALGSAQRRRVLYERVRLSRAEHLDSENARHLAEALEGCTLRALHIPNADRLVEICFAHEDGSARTIAIELFGGRGNWFLLDAKKRVLALAARPGGARSGIGPGAKWSPAPAPPGTNASPLQTDATNDEEGAWLARRARDFAAVDEATTRDALLRDTDRLLRRELKALRARQRGLDARREAEGRADELRREAELLLASPQLAARGLESVVVRDWYDEGRERELTLDAKLDLRGNAQRRFDRAKSLEDGRAHTARERELVEGKLEALTALQARAAELREAKAELEAVRDVLADTRALARPAQSAKPGKRKRAEARKPYHEFRSADGSAIWVGRGRADNDKLTLRCARGNDIWLHVASGLAGSHVVVRLDRGKTASLETLLDAATLALWFSKARGRPQAEVLYTPRKYVRKPKGFAPGLVEVTRSKTLQLQFDQKRLDRLLDASRDARPG